MTTTDIRWPVAMPALLTPFGPTELIDLEAHQRNVAKLAASGVGGFLIAGSTGEGPYLEPGERLDLVRASVDAAPDQTVIGGVHAETLRTALSAVEEIEEGGGGGALVVTPTSAVRGRTSLVVRFYLDVAEASAIPIMLYTVPSVTGWELPVEAIADLALHPNIVGMKDSGGDASRLGDIHDAISGGFIVYAGASRALEASHALGAHGAITASANYAFGLVERAAKGDTEAQSSLTALAAIVERHGIPGTKAAASYAGLEAGNARRPLQPVTAEVDTEIKEAMNRLLGS